MVDDDSFDELVDVSLAGDLVVALGDGHQGGAEADGQVVWVHHVFIAVLRQAGRKGGKESLPHLHLFNIYYNKTHYAHKQP